MTQDAVTPREFARVMGVSYPCVIRWLKRGTIPGAVKEKSPVGEFWLIPVDALKMSKPKRGRPRKDGSNAKA